MPIVQNVVSQLSHPQPALNGGCGRVRLTSRNSAEIGGDFARKPGRGLATQLPDVWIPDSTAVLALARRTSDGARRLPSDAPVIARSPVVIAVERTKATELGWPRRQLGWSELFTAQGSRGADAFRLGLVDPAGAADGLNTLFALTGMTAGGGASPTAATLLDLRQRFSVLDADADPLVQLGHDGLVAMTSTEHEVWAHNRDVAGGSGAVAQYPANTLDASYLYVVRTGLTSGSDRRRLAELLRTDLTSDQMRKTLDRHGFRGPAGAPLSGAAANGGIQPVQFSTPGLPSSDRMNRLLRSWAKAGRPGRTLLVLDVSGSMNARIAGSTKTKIAFAVDSARNALKNFSADADVGLWEFSTNLSAGGKNDYAQLVLK